MSRQGNIKYSHRDKFGVDITILHSIRNHIESVCKDNNNSISRASMMAHVQTDLPNVSMASIDSTRNYLTQAGYISPSEKRGRYLKAKPIPSDLKMSKLILEAYPDRKVA